MQRKGISHTLTTWSSALMLLTTFEDEFLLTRKQMSLFYMLGHSRKWGCLISYSVRPQPHSSHLMMTSLQQREQFVSLSSSTMMTRVISTLRKPAWSSKLNQGTTQSRVPSDNKKLGLSHPLTTKSWIFTAPDGNSIMELHGDQVKVVKIASPPPSWQECLHYRSWLSKTNQLQQLPSIL